MNIELIVLAFDETEKAEESLKILQQLEKESFIEVVNAAVLTKDEKGKTAVYETADVDAKHGALFGAVSGGLLGLLGGPVGAAVGVVAGAATGGIAAQLIDSGFTNKELKKLQAIMLPGSSALIALVEEQWAERAIAELAILEGTLFHLALAADIAAKLATTEATIDLELAGLIAEREAKRKEMYQQVEDDLAKLSADVEAVEAKMADADAQTKAALHEQLENLREKRDQARAELHQKVEAQLHAWQADIDALKKKVVTAGTKTNAAVQEEILSLQNKREAAWAEMQASWQAQRAALRANIKALDEKFAVAEEVGKAKLAAQRVELRTKLDVSEQKLQQSLETQIEEVEAAIGEMQVQTALAKMAAGEAYHDAAHALYLKQHNLRWQLQHAIEDAIEDVEAEIEHLQVQAALANMEAKETTHELLDSLYTKRSALRQKLQVTLRAQAAAWQARVETLTKQMTETEAEAKAEVEKQLVTARAKRDAAKAKLQDFQESNQAARQDIIAGKAKAKEDLKEAVKTAVAEYHN